MSRCEQRHSVVGAVSQGYLWTFPIPASQYKYNPPNVCALRAGRASWFVAATWAWHHLREKKSADTIEIAAMLSIMQMVGQPTVSGT